MNMGYVVLGTLVALGAGAVIAGAFADRRRNRARSQQS
jgi:hypothetical protein